MENTPAACAKPFQNGFPTCLTVSIRIASSSNSVTTHFTQRLSSEMTKGSSVSRSAREDRSSPVFGDQYHFLLVLQPTNATVFHFTLIIVVSNDAVFVVVAGGIEWIELAKLIKSVSHVVRND